MTGRCRDLPVGLHLRQMTALISPDLAVSQQTLFRAGPNWNYLLVSRDKRLEQFWEFWSFRPGTPGRQR
jgi:hypothetical protein